MKKIVLATACFLLVMLCNVQSQQKTITDEGRLFSINIPSNWMSTSSKNVWVTVYVFNDSMSTDQLMMISSKNGKNLKDAYKANKKGQAGLKNFKLIEEGDSQINGEPCKWMVYTFNGKDGTAVKGKQCTLVKSGKGFILQYILLETKFDAGKEAFEKVITTLKLI
jgi:hypothetical protein